MRLPVLIPYVNIAIADQFCQFLQVFDQFKEGGELPIEIRRKAENS